MRIAKLNSLNGNITLTAADRHTYSRRAKAQRSKGFEHVDANFDPPSPEPAHDDPGL